LARQNANPLAADDQTRSIDGHRRLWRRFVAGVAFTVVGVVIRQVEWRRNGLR
jgi:hypothetical protein